MTKTMFPPSITNLLLQEGQRFYVDNQQRVALGTGIIPIVATARGGKTSLAYVMLDYVVRYTNRPIILDSFPQIVLDEGVPDHWKGRVYNTKFENIHTIDQPAVWLVDDTGTSYNSRDSMGSGKVLARVAGILSHFGGGMTVIFTTQILSGVDVSFFRYTNIAPVIRFVDNDIIRHERPEWRDLVLEGQYKLSSVSSGRFLDYFYSSKDKILVKSYFPEWLDKKVDARKADFMSRPMRYHTIEDKIKLLNNQSLAKSKLKEVKKYHTIKDKENLIE